MKPKTHLQIEVDRLSKRLPKLGTAHKKWASLNLFKHYIYRCKDSYTCFECGHTWPIHNAPAMDYLLDETCPKCKLTLISTDRKIRTKREDNRMVIFDVVGRFQLVRFFFVTKHIRLGEKPEIEIDEVVQHWITPEGQDIIRSAKYNGFGQWSYTEGWCLGSALEIRTYGNIDRGTPNKYFINPQTPDKHFRYEYPDAKLIPEIKRNGFRGSTHGYNPAYFFTLILSKPMAETLLKAKQYNMLGEFASKQNEIIENWSSIKICIRNGYKIQNASDWLDHIAMLRELGKDVHNPKYICPANFKEAHQKLITYTQKKKHLDLYKADLKLKAENYAFRKAKRKLFNLVFQNDNITIVALKTIKDFKAEGEILNHCVFVRKYYEKPDSLIMSARIGDKRIETIEISLRELKVLQARGLNNQSTEYHDEIINLVNSNIKSIKKALKQVA